jgi:ATP-dependent helicase/nuclease subunit B
VAGSSAINALDFSRENILRFHKTGLGTLTFDEISVLENYTILWDIEGKLWQEEWDMNPKGLTNSGEVDGEKLAEINRLRKKAIEPLNEFKKSFCGDAKTMAKALYELFQKCGSFDKLRLMSEKFAEVNDSFSGDYLKQAFAEYLKILDSIVTCFGTGIYYRTHSIFLMQVAIHIFKTYTILIGITYRPCYY